VFHNNLKESEKGFSLVELLVAMVIMMIIMLGLLSSVISSIRANTGNVMREEALRLAEDELTRLRSLRFTSTGVDSGLADTGWTTPANWTVNMRAGTVTFSLSRQIAAIGGGANQLRRIDVAVGWDEVGGTTTQTETGRNYQVVMSTVLVAAS